MHPWLSTLSHRLLALTQPWRDFAKPGPRLVDEFECALAVMLAIAFAHGIGASNVAWAAYSAYMVMRGHVRDTLLRGSLRIVGTGVGALLAVGLVPLVIGNVISCVAACAIVGGVTLYLSLIGKRSYAWLFLGLTFEMILLDKLERPSEAIDGFALTRFLEVVAGTAAGLVVSAMSTWTVRRRWPAARVAAGVGLGWQPNAVRHAAQGAVALAALPLLWAWFKIPELAQGSITIMASMLVPVTSLAGSALVPVSRRLVYRAIGCLSGSLVAAVALLVAKPFAAMLVAATFAGVMIGRHVENSGSRIAYAGTQFVLALLVVLVPDSFANADIEPAIERLIGILMGLVVLEPVLVIWHLVAPRFIAADDASGKVSPRR
ncbi:hypothetical protein BH09PSE6_BH09PSE6_13850 [soil metagenome]